jgi:ComF family protein
MAGPALDFLRRAGRVALDAVLPPLCLLCGAQVAEPASLCAPCWAKLRWLGDPLCDQCGAPFEFDPTGGRTETALRCAACTAAAPRFDRARAVVAYDDVSKRLMLGYKHADRLHATPAFANWLQRAGQELIEGCDAIAPVPLHWVRLAWRRYNQAAELGRRIASQAGKPFIPDLLRRRRRTPSQGTLSRSARFRNVQGAFTVNPRRVGAASGARILLVDDVLTTGATVEECARVLKRSGAAAVDVLTLARVIMPVDVS